MNRSVWIGFDPREGAAFAVARYTAQRHCNVPIPIFGVVLDELRRTGLYDRPTHLNKTQSGANVLWDDISGAPMSTEFAISRFLVPHLAKLGYNTLQHARNSGWALFMDADMLVRGSLTSLFDLADDRYAVMVVKHDYNPPEGTKMDGQQQLSYARKNWSSVMLFNCEHPANSALTPELVNSVPGRDLHRFCWLDDAEIGELGPEWNYLVGHHNSKQVAHPNIVHFTLGIPTMPGYEQCEYSDEWFAALAAWAHR